MSKLNHLHFSGDIIFPRNLQYSHSNRRTVRISKWSRMGRACQHSPTVLRLRLSLSLQQIHRQNALQILILHRLIGLHFIHWIISHLFENRLYNFGINPNSRRKSHFWHHSINVLQLPI